MRRRPCYSIALATVCAGLMASSGAARGADEIELRLHSAALGRDLPYIVVRPAPERGRGPFPVLYLLHGYDGDYTNWTRKTRLLDLVRSLDLVVVTPDGANSWYVNAANGERWEEYIATDLVAEIEAHQPVIARRRGRAIAGLSMGGYGAVRIALAHPDRYAIAASVSGAFDITGEDSVFSRKNSPDVLAVFGAPGSQVRRANDLFTVVSAANAAGAPYLWLACGSSDPWLPVNRRLDAAMTSRGLAHEFHERPGGHAWDYWDRELPEILAMLQARGFVR
ncbi:MAG TPA: alpha/beta hydrolase family protein [Vicinamibacterales bacterium]|nr:alpha/beta hydrolase family protein [Vicinamibacterales bacterium]